MTESTTPQPPAPTTGFATRVLAVTGAVTVLRTLTVQVAGWLPELDAVIEGIKALG